MFYKVIKYSDNGVHRILVQTEKSCTEVYDHYNDCTELDVVLVGEGSLISTKNISNMESYDYIEVLK